jgi:hypothetical protein
MEVFTFDRQVKMACERASTSANGLLLIICNQPAIVREDNGRPVTAINGSLDPTAVTNDGFGPVPGYDDGNPATVAQAGWRPPLTTPNHPEYPPAHGYVTSAMAEVFSTFLGTNQINIDIQRFDAAGPPGNMNAVRHFEMPNHLRDEIVHARLWAGLHYHFSGVAGVVLGRQVAVYDLKNAFRPVK